MTHTTLLTIPQFSQEEITKEQPPTPNLKEIEGPSTLEEKYGKNVVTKDGVVEDMLSGSDEGSTTSESSDHVSDVEDGTYFINTNIQTYLQAY